MSAAACCKQTICTSSTVCQIRQLYISKYGHAVPSVKKVRANPVRCDRVKKLGAPVQKLVWSPVTDRYKCLPFEKECEKHDRIQEA